ncbi:MAG: hypothetical protein COB02_01310 [Candidatus Cloacimonadota bacterium]|nr:MAG: hypothetical protein COB02_01310 [Candidatus Cloacimonadota bacterium]
MNFRLVLFLIFLVLAFVAFVGKDVFTSLARKSDSEKLNKIVRTGYEGPSKVAVNRLNLIKGYTRIKHKNSLITGKNLAERRYLNSLDNLLKEKKSLKEKQDARNITKFLETEAGQLLDLGLEKLRQGNRDEARIYITQALDMHSNFDEAIYMIFLKTLIHSYVHEKNVKRVDESVLKYLSIIKKEYSFRQLSEYVNELIDRIEEKRDE